jgi:RNA polymerase sigma-70 factor (ECF subfamily)
MQTERDEKELLRLCQRGDQQAFKEIVTRYERRACSLAYSFVNNWETAKDLAQDAFVRVFKAIHRFDLQRNFYTWLYQIVANLCIDHLRRVSGTKTVDIDELGDAVGGTTATDPGGAAESDETRVRVHQILGQLPMKYRSVLTMRDIQGLSCEEIGRIIECNSGTVRWRLHQARLMFKEIWESHSDKEEQ